MPRISIDTLDDPRLFPYRNLRDRKLAREGGLFIAEGHHIVRRLLASSLQVHSVLATPRRAAEIGQPPDERAPLYVASPELVNEIVGFRFHSGILAAGMRPPTPDLNALLRGLHEPLRVLVLPKVINTANLGLLLRTAAGFHVDAVLLGPACCDPFYRQAVRQSMGAVFNMPLIRLTETETTLETLRRNHGMELIAAVLDPDATALPECPSPRRLGLLLGSEDHGLEPPLIARCDRRVTIPMPAGTDSLNVATSAAVLLYHFTLAASRPEAAPHRQ